MTDQHIDPLPDVTPAVPPADHLWLGDAEGHNCKVCAVRDDALRLCWPAGHPDVLDDTFAWSIEVVETLRHGMDYLTGARPDVPDWDALGEQTALADALLTFVVQLVADRIVDA